MNVLATIVAVNVKQRLAVTDAGETFSLETLFDADSDETDDVEAARSATGRHPSGRWVALDLDDFEMRRAN